MFPFVCNDLVWGTRLRVFSEGMRMCSSVWRHVGKMFPFWVEVAEGNTEGTKIPILSSSKPFGCEGWRELCEFGDALDVNLGFVPVNDLGKDLVLWPVDTTIHLKLLEEWIAVSVDGVTFAWHVGVDFGGWRQAAVELVEFVRSLEGGPEVRSDACMNGLRVLEVDKWFGCVVGVGEVKLDGVTFVVRGVLAWVNQVVVSFFVALGYVDLERE